MTQFEYVTATSGYVHCECLDCMDMTVPSSGDNLCHHCDAAGCEPLRGCQRDDIYE